MARQNRERRGLALLLDQAPAGAAVTLDQLSQRAQLVRRSPPAMFEREPSDSRAICSANDWYFAGFVHGLLGTVMRKETRVSWYCSQRGAYEQIEMGYVHGAQLRMQRRFMKLKPGADPEQEVSEDDPDDYSDRFPQPGENDE